MHTQPSASDRWWAGLVNGGVSPHSRSRDRWTPVPKSFPLPGIRQWTSCLDIQSGFELWVPPRPEDRVNTLAQGGNQSQCIASCNSQWEHTAVQTWKRQCNWLGKVSERGDREWQRGETGGELLTWPSMWIWRKSHVLREGTFIHLV